MLAAVYPRTFIYHTTSNKGVDQVDPISNTAHTLHTQTHTHTHTHTHTNTAHTHMSKHTLGGGGGTRGVRNFLTILQNSLLWSAWVPVQ